MIPVTTLSIGGGGGGVGVKKHRGPGGNINGSLYPTGFYLGGLRGGSSPPPSKKKVVNHSGHSLLCLKIINILMHQIASQHISFSKKF